MDKAIRFEKRIKRYGRYAVLVVSILFFIFACKQKPKATLVFVGDILLSRNVQIELNQKDYSPWLALDSLFQAADLVIGNLEGAVGDSAIDYLPEEKSPVFSIQKADIPLLKAAGFDALSVENNHSWDLSEKGRLNTFHELVSNQIDPLTFKNSPFFITINDLTISIISVNTVKDRFDTQQQIPSMELERKIRQANTLSNYTIFFIHWGSELLEWPDKEQRRMADWLTKAGVDLIIGSHPHVIQNPEIVNGKPVYYSLGNHLFDQKYNSTKKGLMAFIEIFEDKIVCSGLETSLQLNSFYPFVSAKSDFYYEGNAPPRLPLIINKMPLYAESITGSEKRQIILKSQDENTWKSEPLNFEYIETMKDSSNTEYLFMLKDVYSTIDNEINIRPYAYSIDKSGLVAKWRGSALAWPLLDAKILDRNDCILCAKHRGDSFINLDRENQEIKIAAYKWNGFGFNLLTDPTSLSNCQQLFGYPAPNH